MLRLLVIYLIFLAVYIIASYIRTGNKKIATDTKSFWETESMANSVRSKNISTLPYITVPIVELPFGVASSNIDITKLESQIKSLSTERIINLSAYTNTELKLMYGPANLTSLSDYDENFTILIRHLYKWGRLLNDNNYTDEAIIVLEYGVNIGSDISGHFKLLADLYISKNALDKIETLIEKANLISSLSKATIINNLNNIKSLN